MTYLEFYTLATNGGDVLKRVKVAAVVWAIQASALPPTAPNKEGKQALATKIFQKSDGLSINLAWFTLATGGLSGDPTQATDAQIQSVVNDLCDTYFEAALEIPDLNSVLA
jgi:hypothetical protein